MCYCSGVYLKGVFLAVSPKNPITQSFQENKHFCHLNTLTNEQRNNNICMSQLLDNQYWKAGMFCRGVQ